MLSFFKNCIGSNFSHPILTENKSDKNTTAQHCDRFNWPQSPTFVVARHMEGEIDEAISQKRSNNSSVKKRENKKHKKEMSRDPR